MLRAVAVFQRKATPQIFAPLSPWLLMALPFSLATGLPLLVALAFLGAFLDWRRVKSNLLERSQIGRFTLIYLFLVFAFQLLYVTQSRLDLFPIEFRLSNWYFLKVAGASFLVVLLPILFKDSKDCLQFMSAVALGALVRGGVTVLLTSYYLSLPSTGDVFDFRTWSVGNRSPFSNMLILAAVFYIALLSNRREFSLGFSESVRSLFFLSLAVAFGALLQARLFLIIVFVVCPGIVLLSFFVNEQRSKNLALMLVFFLLCALGFYMISYTEIWHRGPVVSSALSDIRFELYKSFWQQISTQPWLHAQLDPVLIERYGIPQFHNFFADVQRVSGTWAFLAAVTLVAYISYLVGMLVWSGVELGRFLGIILIPCLIVLNTSVEPEGGGQNYLMVLLIGVVAAIRFDRKKFASS